MGVKLGGKFSTKKKQMASYSDDFGEEESEYESDFASESDYPQILKSNENSVAMFLKSGRVFDFLKTSQRVKLAKPTVEKQYSGLTNFTGSICFGNALIQALASLECIQTKTCKQPSFAELKRIMSGLNNPESRNLDIRVFYATLKSDFENVVRKYDEEMASFLENYKDLKTSPEFLRYRAEKNKNIDDDFRSYLKYMKNLDVPAVSYITQSVIDEYFNAAGTNRRQSDSSDFFRQLITLYNPVFDDFKIEQTITLRCDTYKKELARKVTEYGFPLILKTPFELQDFFLGESLLYEILPGEKPFCFENISQQRQIKHTNTKKVTFRSMGKVCFFHLIRAEHHDGIGVRHNDRFEVVENFKWPRDGPLYRLKSVVCHDGSANGGHYITFALRGGDWFNFNDGSATMMQSFEIVKESVEKSCVQLFYER